MDLVSRVVIGKPVGHEAPEEEGQKWMFESIKGTEDITVEKGENNGKYTWYFILHHFR